MKHALGREALHHSHTRQLLCLPAQASLAACRHRSHFHPGHTLTFPSAASWSPASWMRPHAVAV